MSDYGDPHGAQQRGYPPQPQAGYPQQGYPPQGYGQFQAPPPPAKKSGCGKALLIGCAVFFGLIVVLVVVAALGSGDEKDDPDGGDTPAAGSEVHALGATAHTGDFDVTVHAIEDPFTEGTEIIAPEAGHRFIAVEATVKNTSDQPQPFSTLAGVELIDQLDRPWTVTVTGSGRPSLDAATVAPGEARRGWVMFSLPTDATELRIRIKGNLTANGSVFQLN